MFYCSGWGKYEREKLSVKLSRDLIRYNFDQNSANIKDDIRVLITTDVLSEGTNLHRSNLVVNYDLPWNPIKVMQRVGRINRLGTKHTNLFVYNFFPTSKADEHLGLKDNIKSKIQTSMRSWVKTPSISLTKRHQVGGSYLVIAFMTSLKTKEIMKALTKVRDLNFSISDYSGMSEITSQNYSERYRTCHAKLVADSIIMRHRMGSSRFLERVL